MKSCARTTCEQFFFNTRKLNYQFDLLSRRKSNNYFMIDTYKASLNFIVNWSLCDEYLETNNEIVNLLQASSVCKYHSLSSHSWEILSVIPMRTWTLSCTTLIKNDVSEYIVQKSRTVDQVGLENWIYIPNKQKVLRITLNFGELSTIFT